MPQDQSVNSKLSKPLRQRAEENMRLGRVNIAAMSLDQVQSLVYELQVHQIELEMQNEELVRAQLELADARDRYLDLYELAPVGYLTLGPDHHIDRCNLAAAEILGVERNKVLGAVLASFVAADYRDACYLCVRDTLESGLRKIWECAIPRADQAMLFARLEIAPLDPHSPASGCRVTMIDITDRQRATEALQQAKAAADAANNAKSQFLANMSHELRTPMNAILGMIDLALPRQADSLAREFLGTAKNSANLLLGLLDNLLDLAKIESQKLELQLAPFSLRRILHETEQVLTLQAKERGIAFSSSIPPELPDAMVGDEVRLRQVLLNLAANAVKFTERGEVAVSVQVESLSQEAVGLEFSVRDTGIGIPRRQLEHIFERFAQADASTTRRFGGSGLGLSISSSLIGMMGGRIWVESEEGKGSTFYFTVRLPLAKELTPQPPLPTLGISRLPRSKLRILLVEDNPANQRFASYFLANRGHTVEIAGDGQQGLRMARQHYDVILMDVQMPGMDGLDVAKAIRAQEKDGPRVPIVAMTAHAMTGDRDRCLAAGMDAYLSKPVNGQQMIALVESLAGGTGPAIAPPPM